MKIIRQLHLYLGLFMTPWVLMYAVTGFMFNHGSVFQSGGGGAFGGPVQSNIVPGTRDLITLPPAAGVANQVISGLNAEAGSPTWTLSKKQPPRLSSQINFVAESDGKEWNVMGDPVAGRIVVQLIRRPSSVSSQKPAASSSWIRYLKGLHSSAGYPGPNSLKPNISRATRVGWAIIVDGIAFVMCFWAVSGIMMWLQLKSLRLPGIATLIVSALAACFLAVGMHQFLTAP